MAWARRSHGGNMRRKGKPCPSGVRRDTLALATTYILGLRRRRKQKRPASGRCRGRWAPPAAATASLINGGDCYGSKAICRHVYRKKDPDQLATVHPDLFRQVNKGGWAKARLPLRNISSFRPHLQVRWGSARFAPHLPLPLFRTRLIEPRNIRKGTVQWSFFRTATCLASRG